MSLETIELTDIERKFLESYLKIALFEEIHEMRKDAINHILQKSIGKYKLIGATIREKKYIAILAINSHIEEAIIGIIPEIYQDKPFYPFGAL